MRPKLTTVRIQRHGAGHAAANILLRLMNAETASVDIETVLPVELVVRESTALVFYARKRHAARRYHLRGPPAVAHGVYRQDRPPPSPNNSRPGSQRDGLRDSGLPHLDRKHKSDAWKDRIQSFLVIFR
ncbi:substrate-binding domain-containing protein [Sinorhizobium garamanticum]